MPVALKPLSMLATQLRQHGFSIAPDQTIGFIEAVSVLGPNSINDIRHAAIALFAIPPERMSEFDAVFRSLFFGITVAAEAKGDGDDVDAFESAGDQQSVDLQEMDSEVGAHAANSERLNFREFTAESEDQVLIDFQRRAKRLLPRRLSYRWRPTHSGDKLDFRRTLKKSAKFDGEIIDLAYRRRKERVRKILLLIDVSGSMKERSASSLRFAHALVHSVPNVEVFTLGTRLTRISTALSSDNRDLALYKVGQLVADFDGGTRIGGALGAFLSIPRYAGFARGAAVVVLSDALERGEPDELVVATQQLSRMAWRLNWLTPLAHDAQFEPQTNALKLILPYIDQLSDGHSVEAMCRHLLQLARTA